MALTTIGGVPQWGGVADWSSCRTAKYCNWTISQYPSKWDQDYLGFSTWHTGTVDLNYSMADAGHMTSRITAPYLVYPGRVHLPPVCQELCPRSSGPLWSPVKISALFSDVQIAHHELELTKMIAHFDDYTVQERARGYVSLLEILLVSSEVVI